MKNFDEYRNFYAPSDDVSEVEQKYIYPEPKTFKEWAVSKLERLDFDLPANFEPKTFMECALAVRINPRTYKFPTTDVMLAQHISGYAISTGMSFLSNKVLSVDGETPANIFELLPNYKYGRLYGSIEEELVELGVDKDGYTSLPATVSGEVDITSVFARISKLLPKTPIEIYMLHNIAPGFERLFPGYSIAMAESDPGTAVDEPAINA